MNLLQIIFEHPCCNAKGDVYAKERILIVDDVEHIDIQINIIR